MRGHQGNEYLPCLLLYKTSPEEVGESQAAVCIIRGNKILFSLELVLHIVEIDVGEVDILFLGQFPVLAVPCVDLGDLGHLGALDN